MTVGPIDSRVETMQPYVRWAARPLSCPPAGCASASPCAYPSRPQVKIIDFGAACDLSTGINYNPLFGMLDPRYAGGVRVVWHARLGRGCGGGTHSLGQPQH